MGKLHKILVDDEIMEYLKNNAEPFVDTPNMVLRKLLLNFSNQYNMGKDVESYIPSYPLGTPISLEQILSVIYLVHSDQFSRVQATKIVAHKHNVAVQTVMDKYSRQLGKNSQEIDGLLETNNLMVFKSLLTNKYPNYKKVIAGLFKIIE